MRIPITPEKKLAYQRARQATPEGKLYNRLQGNRRYAKLRQEKLIHIKDQAYICPGCGDNHNNCNEKQLLMIFEMSHMHSRSCSLRISKRHASTKDIHFYACRVCNGAGAQGSRCGYWKEPGCFIETCLEKT